MELNALFRRVVGPNIAFALHDIARIKHHIVVIFGIDDLALHDQMIAGADLIDHGLVVVRAQKT